MSEPNATPNAPTSSDAPPAKPAAAAAAGETASAGRGRILIGSQRDTAAPVRAPLKPKAKPNEGESDPVERNQPAGEAVANAGGSHDSAVSEPAAPVVAPPVLAPPVSPQLAQAVPSPAAADTALGSSPPPAEPAAEPKVPLPATSAARVQGETTAASTSGGELPVEPEMSLDDEIEAALGGLSLEQILAGDSATAALTAELEPDSRVKATVRMIHGDNVFVSLQGRHEGLTSLRQFKTPPQPGAVLDVVVKRFNGNDGLYEVAVPGASVSVADWTDLTPGSVVEARVTGSNTGGLEVQVNSIRGFIPASQIDLYRVEQFGDYLNQRLQCVVTEANEGRQKLVLSRRAILEREKETKRQELLGSLAVGELRDGVVTKLMDFGAFVDVGGLEGLVHISKLSWDRVTHPSEVLKAGEKIKVKVEKVDPASGKISLSYRDTMQDPWEQIEQKYPVNSVVRGTVSRIAQFGAFVKLEPGVEGLVHISELAHHRVFAVRNVVQEGQEIEVKILAIDRPAQKMSLSLKATQARPEPKAAAAAEEIPDEPPRPLAVKQSGTPLKGGRDRSSGGDSVGLHW